MNDWTISQSAASLDVSDDESKSRELDDRGKENIDPNEISVPMTRSMAAAKAASEELKKDLMVDDRKPLGDLNPAAFYAEGLDATSVVLVQDEVHEEQEAEAAAEAPAPGPIEKADLTFDSSELRPQDTELSTEDIGAVIMTSVPKWEVAADPLPFEPTQDESGLELALQQPEDIEIWESESAKDENEKADDGVFALQEL
jgi:hypothetical protein